MHKSFIKSVRESPFSSEAFTAPQRPNGPKIGYVSHIKGILNLCIIGSKVSAEGLDLPPGSVASARVCACNLRRRLVYKA